MPFTLSHPAAVLPLLRHPFSAAALVAGAVAPDLPYFARSTPIPVSAQSWYEPFMNATTSHGLVGAVTVSLPYAVALWVLYLIARPPVVALLPDVVGPPVPATTSGSVLLRRGGWVLLSLVIGIATHLVWDSFTHSDGWVVLNVPGLSTPLVGDLTWARALQHASTVVGLVLIAWYLWRRRSRLLPDDAGRRPAARHQLLRLLWIVVGVAVVGAVASTLPSWPDAELPARQVIESVLSTSATGAGAALIAALLLYVATWWVARGVQASRQSR
ncbi:DUF4184 family protein [Promicromonospora sp. Populi]|uniref:DUF4184 family protein n=1 Tax=Promicromonospora sp. Populi TaxID=3239420 RepID=UPI0034E261F6